MNGERAPVVARSDLRSLLEMLGEVVRCILLLHGMFGTFVCKRHYLPSLVTLCDEGRHHRSGFTSDGAFAFLDERHHWGFS